MRVASKIVINTATTDWRGNPEEACLELQDDEHDVMARVKMSDLAAALAPYLVAAMMKAMRLPPGKDTL